MTVAMESQIPNTRVPADDPRSPKNTKADAMSEEQTRKLTEIVLRLPRADQRLVLSIAQVLAGQEGRS